MGTELVPQVRTIVDDKAGLIRALTELSRQGRLVYSENSGLFRLPDGRYGVRVTVLIPTPTPMPAPAKRNRLLVVSLIAAGIGSVILALIAVLLHLIVKAVEDINAPAALGALVLGGILLLAGLANRSKHSGACPGIVNHCPGCKH